MEGVWDSTTSNGRTPAVPWGGGEGDDGSLATSSSIPSIRMAGRLNSSSAMYEEDTSLCSTYDGGVNAVGFDMGGGASFFGVPAYSATNSNRGGGGGGGAVEDGYAIHVDHTSTLLVDPEDDVDSQYMDEYHPQRQQQQQQQLPQQQQQHQYHPQQQHQHLPPDMAVTPSPPRRAARSFFDDDIMGGGEETKQIKSERLRNGAMEWLRTVEVGRNNRYVAEAASSKFLTGKRSHPNTTSNNVSSNRMMGGGLGGVGGGLIQGYPMGKRVHSDGAAIAPKTAYLKAKRGVPVVTTNATTKPEPSNPSTPAATTSGTTAVGTGNASNIVRSQVMGRSINTSHGPTTGGRKSGRGTKNVSRPRLSAAYR